MKEKFQQKAEKQPIEIDLSIAIACGFGGWAGSGSFLVGFPLGFLGWVGYEYLIQSLPDNTQPKNPTP